tara:strand:- start:770 stop:3145 length:2376 start_codon:yes stop_codon:yes gene_type:complete
MRPIRFASTGHIIEGSGLFDGSSGTLARTPGSAGNVDTYTLEFIFKLNDAGSIAVNNYLFAAGTAGANRTIFYVNTANKLGMLHTSGGATTLGRETTALLRDPSSYYQVIYVVDTSESTAADRCKMYLNGTLIEDFSYEVSTIAQNANTFVNSTDPQRISRGAASAANYADVYMARTTLIDGQALDPTSFGETTDDGFWSISDVSGLDFGDNGFLLEGGSAISAGTDSSGNSNNFSKTGSIISTSDSPTNSDDGYGNYCTLDPLNQCKNTAAATISNGNLKFGSTSTSTVDSIGSTLLIPETGEWYWEVTYHNPDANYPMVGISNHLNARSYNDYIPGRAIDPGDGVSLYAGGLISYGSNNTKQAYQSPNYTSNGTVVAFHWNSSTGVLKSSNDGSSYTTMRTLTGDGPWMVYIGSGDTNEGTINFGASDFAYTQVSGTATLQTANLPEPAIINPADHFYSEVVTHDGSSTASTCTFNLDTYEWLAIIKNTTGAVEKWYWIDSLNGVNKYWSSNANTAITTDANVLTVSGTTFTLGSTLGAKKYLVEFHRAGLASATAANTAGSLHSTKTSFNTESGFVIHLYEGTGANATLGNPLSKALDFMIAKRLDGTDRALAWHKDLDTPTTGYLDLATTAPEANHASIWNSTIPTATLISLGTNSNVNNAGTQVLFGWHIVDSYSLFWRHEGTANASGPFINTGSYPNVILTKDIDTAADSWYYFNQALSAPNQWGYPLLLQGTHVPVDNSALDAVSNGIKLRSTNSPNVASSYVGAMWGGTPIQGDGKINQGRAK